MTPSNLCYGCEACCCKYVLVPDTMTQGALPEVAEEYHKIRSVGKKVHKDGHVTYLMSQPCPKLDDDDLCTIYKDRPQLCKDFPMEYNEHWAPFCKAMRSKYAKRKKGFRVLREK